MASASASAVRVRDRGRASSATRSAMRRTSALTNSSPARRVRVSSGMPLRKACDMLTAGYDRWPKHVMCCIQCRAMSVYACHLEDIASMCCRSCLHEQRHCGILVWAKPGSSSGTRGASSLKSCRRLVKSTPGWRPLLKACSRVLATSSASSSSCVTATAGCSLHAATSPVLAHMLEWLGRHPGSAGMGPQRQPLGMAMTLSGKLRRSGANKGLCLSCMTWQTEGRILLTWQTETRFLLLGRQRAKFCCLVGGC